MCEPKGTKTDEPGVHFRIFVRKGTIITHILLGGECSPVAATPDSTRCSEFRFLRCTGVVGHITLFVGRSRWKRPLPLAGGCLTLTDLLSRYVTQGPASSVPARYLTVKCVTQPRSVPATPCVTTAYTYRTRPKSICSPHEKSVDILAQKD